MPIRHFKLKIMQKLFEVEKIRHFNFRVTFISNFKNLLFLSIFKLTFKMRSNPNFHQFKTQFPYHFLFFHWRDFISFSAFDAASFFVLFASSSNSQWYSFSHFSPSIYVLILFSIMNYFNSFPLLFHYASNDMKMEVFFC